MQLNPLAVLCWIVAGIVGYLIGDFRGALIGVAALMSVSIVLGAISGR